MLKSSPACRHSAFTLVEVLVVITIIGVLVAMLLPSLANAREAAKQAVCAGMYHSLQSAVWSSAGDNKDVAPSMNSGSYASLGIAGPGSPGFGSTAAQGQTFINNANTSGSFVRFGIDYLRAIWKFDTATGYMFVPKAYLCPGVGSEKKVQSWMPGHPTGTYALGEATWGGNIVGFGSFLGLYHNNCSTDRSGIGSNGGMNGVYRSRKTDANSANAPPGDGYYAGLRLSDFQNPADDVIFVDALFQRGGGWNIPHGLNGRPSGINQGFVDGSVRFFAHRRMNYYYQPAYPWDRSIITPMCLTAKAQFNLGGYNNVEWNWNPTTPRWFGTTTPNGGNAYIP